MCFCTCCVAKNDLEEGWTELGGKIFLTVTYNVDGYGNL